MFYKFSLSEESASKCSLIAKKSQSLETRKALKTIHARVKHFLAAQKYSFLSETPNFALDLLHL